MDYSEEWKSLWPISSVFSPPLLLLNDRENLPPPPSKRRRFGQEEEEEEKTHEKLGPLIFTPCPKTLVKLHSSPSLSPRLPPPYPALSLTRFFQTTTPSLLCSAASDIASEFGPEFFQAHHNSYSHLHGFNSLQLLPLCGGSFCCLAFFPTGENCDRVGFVKLCIKENSQLSVELKGGKDGVFVANEKFNYRILQLLVNPVSDFDDSLPGDAATSSSGCFVVVGYLMACTMHSVHWYVVKSLSGGDGSRGKSAVVDFVGQRLFRSCEVVHACWSPHLCEESVVLLETGELYLFDISSCLEKHSTSSDRVGGRKLKILWGENTDLENSGHGCWFSVQFSWHPRILIVAHASAVFLVDARSEGCNVSCLLKIEMLSTVQNDRFIAMCQAGSDGFNFCVSSRRLLLLCDVRQPFRPLLKWIHGLDNPHYITVFRLSQLRSSTKNDEFKWATESGSCILLGSFWNCEFSLFIYGPSNDRKSVSSEILKFCNSFYAWGLPSEFSLSAHDTDCGSCLIREEFLKDALPDWIDWRQKIDVILGFGILDAQLSKSDNLGGFLLIRLISSGTLEAQRYHAVWEFDRISDETHKAHNMTSLRSEDNLLYDMNDGEDDLKKKFQHLTLDYLKGYLKGNLPEILNAKIKQFHKVSLEEEVRKDVDKKWMAGRSLSGIFDAFKDIYLPTSIHEIALRSIWAGMPTYLLQLAFSCYSEYPRVPRFEFSDIPDQIDLLQFPFQMPSISSNKWSNEVQPSNALMGCSVPPQFLLTLHKLHVEKLTRNENFGAEKVDILSADDELKFKCDKVMEAADELTGSHTEADSELHDGHAISLADDTDELSNVDRDVKKFSFHEPVAFSDEVSSVDITLEKSATGNNRFTTFLFRKHELSSNVNLDTGGLELLNTGCPLDLKFNDQALCLGLKELKTFKLLKKQDLDFQKGFGLYQEYISRLT